MARKRKVSFAQFFEGGEGQASEDDYAPDDVDDLDERSRTFKRRSKPLKAMEADAGEVGVIHMQQGVMMSTLPGSPGDMMLTICRSCNRCE